ncbi:MAG: biotin--[acetyl-CoA-carboxylase] ligase [Betaproteobacteria bacterium]
MALTPSSVPTERQRAAFTVPLDAAALAAALGGDCAVQVALRTGSTNADLLALARAAAPARPVLRATLEQTAGRGRLGRRWSTPPGAALLFSLAVPLPAAAAPAASLVAGLALAEALHDAGVGVQVKWPNDLLLGGGKLAGILVELATAGDGARTLVVGVGLNLWCTEAQRAEVGRPLAALADVLSLATLAAQREAWLARLARALLAALRRFAAEGFVPFHARYVRHLAWVEAEVELTEHQARVARGTLRGVDGDGRLLVEVQGRLAAFVAGELSLRPAVPVAA